MYHLHRLPLLLLVLWSDFVAVSQCQASCDAQEDGIGGALMQAKSRYSMQNKYLGTDAQDQCTTNMVQVGGGSCYDSHGVPESLGWSKTTCQTEAPGFLGCNPSCPGVEYCKTECLENPDCGGFMYADRACWMFKTIYQPTAKNDSFSWYTCYAKDRCCPGKCCAPFKYCGAWGETHYSTSFYNYYNRPIVFDNAKVGVMRLAQSGDQTFELQSFTCPYHPGTSINVGYALKVDGHTITIIGDQVKIDGILWTNATHPSGLQIMTVYAAGDKQVFDSPNNCVHFQTTHYAHSPSPTGYFHNMHLYVAESIASTQGTCGNPGTGQDPIPGSQSLFGPTDLANLCSKCSIQDCAVMTPPSNFVSASSPEMACRQAGVLLADAEARCAEHKANGGYYKSCMHDYCASGSLEKPGWLPYKEASTVESQQEDNGRPDNLEFAMASKAHADVERQDTRLCRNDTRHLQEGHIPNPVPLTVAPALNQRPQPEAFHVAHIYYINEDRSVDRRDSMELRLPKAKTPYSRFAAVSKLSLSEYDLQSKPMCPMKKEDHHLPASTYACAQSHLEVYRKIVREDPHGKDAYLILEDDADLVEGWDEKLNSTLPLVPKDAVALILGSTGGADCKDEVAPGLFLATHPSVTLDAEAGYSRNWYLGSTGTLVWPRTLPMLIEKIEKQEFACHSDVNLLSAGAARSYALFPAVVTVNGDFIRSTMNG